MAGSVASEMKFVFRMTGNIPIYFEWLSDCQLLRKLLIGKLLKFTL